MKIYRASAIGAFVFLLLQAVLVKVDEHFRQADGNWTAASAAAISEDIRTTPQTKVLLVRTVSPNEVENVLADVRAITAYQESIRWPLDGDVRDPKDLLTESLSQCDDLRNSTSGRVNVFQKGSAVFPNRILCDAERTSLRENNYLAVRADFFLFAKNQGVVDQMNRGLENSTRHDINQIEIVDVSANPIKIWNWLTRLTDARVAGYDYVWMMDGDISAASLNWHAFWQQIKFVGPRIAQPAIIGNGPGKFTSKHPILVHQGDPRVLAAEVAIVELMAPMFRVSTWLGFREVMFNQPEELIRILRSGGEDCFDLVWCHYAKTNLTGQQVRPGRGAAYHPDNPTYASLDNTTHGLFKDQSCVVFYQTPMVHVNKHALAKLQAFRQGGQLLCKFLREKYHIHMFTLAVYQVFVTPA